MEIKKTYNKEKFLNVWRHQKTIEDLIREILSKVCSLHGKHANIELNKDGSIIVAACCEDFHELIKKIINHYEKYPDGKNNHDRYSKT